MATINPNSGHDYHLGIVSKFSIENSMLVPVLVQVEVCRPEHHINYVSIHTKASLLVTNYLPSLPLYLSSSLPLYFRYLSNLFLPSSYLNFNDDVRGRGRGRVN